MWLWSIRKVTTLAFLLELLTAVLGLSQMAPIGQLRVAITRVGRPHSDLVEFQYAVNNSTAADVYIPVSTLGNSKRIYFLQILQRNTNNGWMRLGPNYDLPATLAVRLSPGQSRTFVESMSDPIQVPLPGEGIPIHRGRSVPLCGKAKIRIGYYASEAEWLAYRYSIEHFGRKGSTNQPPPEPKFIESSEFDVPAQPGPHEVH